MFVKISKPMYDWGGRKYIEFDMGQGLFRIVKIPWRYNRVPRSVKIEGIRPIQDLGAGETCDVELVQKVWEGQTHWILASIKPLA